MTRIKDVHKPKLRNVNKDEPAPEAGELPRGQDAGPEAPAPEAPQEEGGLLSKLFGSKEEAQPEEQPAQPDDSEDDAA